MMNKVFWGLGLIVVGIILLFVNLGYISPSVFFRLFHLWPLLLIAIGLNILFKKYQMASYIIWIVFFIIIISYSLYGHSTSTTRVVDNNLAMEKFEETKYGELNLDVGACVLNIGSTDSNLLSADITGKELDYSKEFTSNNEVASIDFESRSFDIVDIQEVTSQYDFYLNKDLIWDLGLDLGAISGKIDLEQLPVRSLDLDSGAVDLTVVLGDKHDLYLSIDSGASNLSFIIPKNVGLKIEMDTALSASNIDDLNLIRNGKHYISSNYDSANIRIDMDIDMGVGNIDFSYKE